MPTPNTCCGGETNRDPRKAPGELFTYVNLSSVDRGVITLSDPLVGAEAPSRARRVIREGDVLFSTVRPYLRGHAVVPAELDNSIASTGFAVLRPPEEIEADYLLLALMSPHVVQQCLEAMKGAHYPALKVDQVKKLHIARPPDPATQRRLVESVWPRLTALRGGRVDVVELLTDLLDSLKDSEFALLQVKEDGAAPHPEATVTSKQSDSAAADTSKAA